MTQAEALVPLEQMAWTDMDNSIRGLGRALSAIAALA
jgi:hypothetical protein